MLVFIEPFSKLSVSDIIQILGILASFLTSLIAIVVSVKALRQNSKMLEISSRPYICVYGVSTYICENRYYIIVKNFGQSAAHIKSFCCDSELSKLSYLDNYTPFENIEGASIVPGQSYRCAIDYDKVKKNNINTINFHIVYSSDIHKYKDDLSLKIDGNLGNLEAHQKVTEDTTANAIISETLQDMHIKSL